jgi:hypothetical protein
MTRLFILVAIVLSVSSCQTVRTRSPRPFKVSAQIKPAVPLPEAFYKIHKETYVMHKNDCSNKSAKYAALLNDQGYDVGVAILRIKGSEYSHAVTTIRNADGTTLYCCPTAGTSSTISGNYGELIFVIPYNLLDVSSLFGIPMKEFTFRK